MTTVFRTVLNMSITGAFIAAVIMLIRILLRKLPKKYSYMLWLILALRLLCPVSFSSEFSMFNLVKPETTKNRMVYIPEQEKRSVSEQVKAPQSRPQNMVPGADYPTWEKYLETAGQDRTLTAGQAEAVPAKPETKQTLLETVLKAASGIWLAGMILMMLYTLISCLRVRRKTASAEHRKDNVYYCGQIESPFVFGIVKPCIYLPADIPDEEENYILAHETVHIRRGDHIVKIAALLTLCLHWFNPFVWISYKLMMRDMELSCDERALRSFSGDVRAEYAKTLLHMSARQNGIAFGGILAFGESNIKMRVKGVLRVKKPRLVAAIAAAALIVFASLSLLTNAQKKGNEKNDAGGAENVSDPDGQGKSEVPGAGGQDAQGGKPAEPDVSSGGNERTVYLGDLDGNGQEEYAVLADPNEIGSSGEWEDALSFYFNGEEIYVHEDLLPVSIGERDAYYIDLDADGENEIFIKIWPHVNSMPLAEYAVLKKDSAGAWRKLEVIQEEGSLWNAFPIRFTPGSDRKETVMTLDGLEGKQCSFDVQAYYEKQKRAFQSGGDYYGVIVSDYEQYLNGEGYREYDPGQVADWGIWELTVNEYEGRPCLVATHGILGYDKADWWGNLDVWFDYDRAGKIRFLDMVFYPERSGEDMRDAYGAYAKVLRDLLENGKLPDGTVQDAENRFAVADVDGDNAQELVILSDPGVMADMIGYIIGYDVQSGETYIQLEEFPEFVFLQNGNLKVLMSHNQTYGEMWPYTLYRYIPESDSYVQMGIVYAEDRSRREVGYPQWADKSDTGTVYYVGADYWSEDPIDVREYEEWLSQNGGNSVEVDVQYLQLTEENIAKLEEIR